MSSSVSPLGSNLAVKARRIVFVQLLVTTIVAVAFFIAGIFSAPSLEIGKVGNDSDWEALSALYGGLTSVLLALISIKGFRHANELALSDPKKSMMILYIAAVFRFAAVIIVLGIGLGYLKLEPLPVVICFFLAQASYLMGVRDRKSTRSPD